jgi:hypothetical protein
MSDIHPIRPACVTWLGYGGLLPFIGLVILMLVDPVHGPLWSGALASLLLVVGFVLHLLQDLRLAPAAKLPAWYLPLRGQLTLVACVCLLVNTWISA